MTIAAFAENHFLRINIVVNGVKGVPALQFRLFQKHLGHQLAVFPGKALADFHIMQIVLQI